MGMQKLKAAWKAKDGEDDQYFCVSDDKEERDWLLDIPAAAGDPVSLNDARTGDLSLARLRRVLESDAELRVMTGYGREEFGILYRTFVAKWAAVEEAEIKRRRKYWQERAGKRGPRPAADKYEDYIRNVPLLRGDPLRPSDPGNRCSLHPAYVLLLDLIRKYRNNCQDQLGVMFGVDQAAVCRYIRVADRVLAAMLPTPHRFMDVLRHIDSPEEFTALFPEGAESDTILIDGTHVRFVRAGEKEVRKAMYSGKKKAYTGNTVVMTMPDGMVIAISRTYQGSMHDITITRGFLGDLGAFAKDVLKADLPERTRKMILRVLGDSGFQGLQKDLPGAKVVTPVKKPRGGELTKAQKKHNKRLSKERVLVENAIASIKHYRRASSTYEGTLEDFNSEFNIACGLANARLMLRNGTYCHWQSVLDKKPEGARRRGR